MEEIKCKHVAQLEGSFEMANRVYSPDGLCPTIRTMQGGGLEPKIIEDFYKSREPREFEGVAPTLRSERQGLKAVEGHRFYEQAFETVKENDCEGGDTIDAFNKKVNKSGVSPTVTTRPEGFKTAILVVDEPTAYDEQNGYLRMDGIVGTLTTDGSSPKHNNRVVEPKVYDGFNQHVRRDDSCVGTLTRNCGADLKRNGQGIIETNNENQAASREIRVRKLTPKECWRLMGFSDDDFEKAKWYSKKESEELLKRYPNHKGKKQFTHEGRIEKMSDSQLYKQAGNSIVVDVLMAIFKNLF